MAGRQKSNQDGGRTMMVAVSTDRVLRGQGSAVDDQRGLRTAKRRRVCRGLISPVQAVGVRPRAKAVEAEKPARLVKPGEMVFHRE